LREKRAALEPPLLTFLLLERGNLLPSHKGSFSPLRLAFLFKGTLHAEGEVGGEEGPAEGGGKLPCPPSPRGKYIYGPVKKRPLPKGPKRVPSFTRPLLKKPRRGRATLQEKGKGVP